MVPEKIEGDRACDQCDYVATDDPAEYSSSPGQRLSNHKNKQHRGGGAPAPAAIVPELLPPSDSTGADGNSPWSGAAPAAAPTGEVPPAPAGGSGSAVTPPPSPRRGIRSLLRGKGKPSASPGPGSVGSGERVPKPSKDKPARGGRRVSAADLLALGWGGLGSLMQSNGHIPTGRMVQFQAPVAGEILDDVAAGTALDKIVLQRLVGAKGTLDKLYAILGPPVYTLQLERAFAEGNEGKAAYLESMLKGCIRESLPIMLPAMKRAKAKEEKSNADMAELLDGDELAGLGIVVEDGKPIDRATGQSVDVASVFVRMLFTEWEPTPPAAEDQPTAEENVT